MELAEKLTGEIYEKYPKVFEKIIKHLEGMPIDKEDSSMWIGFDPPEIRLCDYREESYLIPFSMLYGLLEKFFRNEMIIITYHYSIKGTGFIYFIFDRNGGKEYYDDLIFLDKEDSEKRAILKACEILEKELSNG